MPLGPDSVSFLQKAIVDLAEQSPQDLQGHSRGGGAGAATPRRGATSGGGQETDQGREVQASWRGGRKAEEEAGKQSKRLAKKETSHDQDGNLGSIILVGAWT